MWLMTPRGFYSAVQHRDDDELIVVRARAREDLERLLEGQTFGDIDFTPKADYPYRVEMVRSDWNGLVGEMVMEIDYGNFKDAVNDRLGVERAATYMGVWSQLRKIEHEGREPEEYQAPLFPDAWWDELEICGIPNCDEGGS